MKKHILFVDDEPHVLESARRMLRDQACDWDIIYLKDPIEAWEHAIHGDVDVVVTDVQMPTMSGLELLERLRGKEQTQNVPVIIVTGMSDRNLKRAALELGATDLLNKPVDRDELVARIRSALRMKDYEDQLQAQNEILEQTVRERTSQLYASRLDIIWRLGKAAEFRDEDIGNHVIRVGCYSRAIAEAMGLQNEFLEAIFLAAPLHDIGKIGIPDSILLKTGPLTREEWNVMRQHCVIGAKILREEPKLITVFRAGLGTPVFLRQGAGENPVLQMAATIAHSHHEKWDGSGYPRGLVGEEIPLAARIVALSDVYDALHLPRCYKPAFSDEKCLAILRDGDAAHFDPEVFRAFEASLDRFKMIEKECSHAFATTDINTQEQLECVE